MLINFKSDMHVKNIRLTTEKKKRNRIIPKPVEEENGIKIFQRTSGMQEKTNKIERKQNSKWNKAQNGKTNTNI